MDIEYDKKLKKRYFTVKQGGPDERRVYELRDDELGLYKQLGIGYGSFDICVYEGWLHCKNFLDRVDGFKINLRDKTAKAFNDAYRKMKKPGEGISVSFYEKKR